jgi:hypothetical protein
VFHARPQQALPDKPPPGDLPQFVAPAPKNG